MNEIFISYRRADSQYIVGRIYDYLSHQYKKNTVFMDVDSIPLGKNFKKVIENSIKSSKVILVIIGDKWVDLTDEDGTKRIFQENDFVRLEIEVALKYDIPIIPILVNGATMPTEEELPQSIKSISLNNARMIRADPDFHDDIKKLVNSLDLIIKRINLKRRKYFIGALLLLSVTFILGITYFKIVKPYLDVAKVQAQEKKQQLYLTCVAQAKDVYNGKNYNTTLAKHFWAKAISLSSNLDDEKYAKEKYFKIPSVIGKKINLKNIEQYHTAFNGNASEIAFCRNKELILWDVEKNYAKFSIQNKDKCDGILFDNDNFIVTWDEKKIYIRDRANGNLINTIDVNRTKLEYRGDGGVAIDKKSKLIVSWIYKRATLFDFSEDKVKKTNLVNDLKIPLSNKSLQDGITFSDIKFRDSELLIHFKKNLRYNSYAYPYTNSMLYDFKNKKITSAWLHDEYIYLSKDNEFLASYNEFTSSVFIVERNNRINALNWSNMLGRINSISFSNIDEKIYFRENFYDNKQQKHLSVFRVFDMRSLNNEKVLYSLIITNDDLLNKFTGKAIIILDKSGLYKKYLLKNDNLDKDDYILRTEIGTGKRLTSSGDLIEIDDLELKQLKEKYIKKYEKF